MVSSPAPRTAHARRSSVRAEPPHRTPCVVPACAASRPSSRSATIPTRSPPIVNRAHPIPHFSPAHGCGRGSFEFEAQECAFAPKEPSPEPTHLVYWKNQSGKAEHRTVIVTGVGAADVGTNMPKLVEIGEICHSRAPDTRKPAPERGPRKEGKARGPCVSGVNLDRFVQQCQTTHNRVAHPLAPFALPRRCRAPGPGPWDEAEQLRVRRRRSIISGPPSSTTSSATPFDPIRSATAAARLNASARRIRPRSRLW